MSSQPSTYHFPISLENLESSDYERVRFFFQKFCIDLGSHYREGHWIFACYAAFPVMLTPDLLNKLWLNFHTYVDSSHKNYPIHHVAVSDILQSGLCLQIGNGQYEMHEEIRLALLRWLQEEKRLNQTRNIIEQIAHFILRYIQEDFKGTDEYSQTFRQAQELNALMYLQPQIAIQQVIKAFQETDPEEDVGEQLRLNLWLEQMKKQYTLKVQMDPNVDWLTQLKPIYTYGQGMKALHFEEYNEAVQLFNDIPERDIVTVIENQKQHANVLFIPSQVKKKIPKQSHQYPYRIMYDEQDHNWKLNRGLWDGIEPGMKLKIYKGEGDVEGSIDFVSMQRSLVRVSEELTVNQNYPARLTQPIPSNIRIFAPELKELLSNLLPKDSWTSDPSFANLVLSKENNLTVLQNPVENTVITKFPTEPIIISKVFQHINLWSLRQNLINKDSSIQQNEFSLRLYQLAFGGMKEEIDTSQTENFFELDKDESVTLQLEATNQSNKHLFFAVFRYKDDYSLVPFSNVQILPGQRLEVFRGEFSTDNSNLNLIENLQLFVSREKLDDSLIQMEGISDYIQQLQIEKRT